MVSLAEFFCIFCTMFERVDEWRTLKLVNPKQEVTQQTFTCSKSTIETLERVVKYVQR